MEDMAKISFKHNILVNYVVQFYAVVISMIMMPLYVKYMAAEAFGLVGD